jgi:hypothetical protein
MGSTIGEDGLCEYARYQIETARRDPRLDRERGASAADFKIALEEIERIRALAIGGIHELSHALDREEARLGVTRGTPDLRPDVVANLQAAWERTEMARVEIEREHPLLNAQALLSLNSELDAMVEEFVPALRQISISAFADQAIAAAGEQHPEAVAALTPELLELLKKLAVTQLEKAIPRSSGSAAAERGDTRRCLQPLASKRPRIDQFLMISTKRWLSSARCAMS